MIELFIPEAVESVISRLNAAGYEAYAVGGCVRDRLSGITPHDWDVTTSARPELTLELFSEPPFRAIPTGIAHGTVTVLSRGEPIEVTTFRIDGEYSDHRRPDSVCFTGELSADLARRDFTVNAMAYTPTCGVTDPYGGQADLAAGIIRAVGEPERRFTEDALRILRALRFAATLRRSDGEAFTIEGGTARAAKKLAPTLAEVSRERVTVECSKLLSGHNAPRIIAEFFPIFELILPNVRPDAAQAVELIHSLCINSGEKPSLPLLYSTLFSEPSADDFAPLRLDNRTRDRAILLGKARSMPMETQTDARRLCAACAESLRDRAAALDAARDAAIAANKPETRSLIDELEHSGQPIMTTELALGGKELKALGIEPMKIGKIKQMLLEQVLDDPEANTRESLINLLKGIMENERSSAV